MPGHRILIVRNENPSLLRAEGENLRIRNPIQTRGASAPKIDGGFTAKHALLDRTPQVIVGLESRFHLVGTLGTQRRPGSINALSHVVRQWLGRTAHRRKTLALPDSIQVDGRLML